MHRFFVDPQLIGPTAVSFPPHLAHQIHAVLRMTPGTQVLVLDNAGQAYQVTLTAVSRRQVIGQITSRSAAAGEPATHLTLYQAVLKAEHFEWVLQKGTELGVSRFVPIITARTVVTAVRPSKAARWQRILTEAAEQSRRGRIPELAAPMPLAKALATCTADVILMPWEGATGPSIAAALVGRPRSVALFIGPEGGLAAEEIGGRATAVSLGPRILRAETAAIVAVTLVMQACGDLELP